MSTGKRDSRKKGLKPTVVVGNIAIYYIPCGDGAVWELVLQFVEPRKSKRRVSR